MSPSVPDDLYSDPGQCQIQPYQEPARRTIGPRPIWLVRISFCDGHVPDQEDTEGAQKDVVDP